MSTRKTSLSASPLATAAPPAGGGDIAHPLTTHHVTKERNLPHSLDSFHTGQAFPVSLE